MVRAWYAKGLGFECTRCGHCCSGPTEGRVWLEEDEARRIAVFLGIEADDFGRRHLRLVDGRLSLLEKPDRDCIFYHHEKGCTIHPVRPAQCRTYPFWPENLGSPAAWNEAAGRCPGIGNSGRLHTKDQIESLLAETP